MGGELAFAVQVVHWHPCHHDIRESIHSRSPSEALEFSLFINKMGRSSLQTRLKAGSNHVAKLLLSENVAGRLGQFVHKE
jgi:hypothetical protein